MSTHIQEKIIQLVKENEPPIKSLSVTWFGGEPLIALPVVEKLSKKFINLSKENFSYEASIITNGWLFTPDISRLLADLCVKSVQITIDGPREIHNRRRPRIGGKPTFDRIIDNIAASDPRLHINVRMNVDQENIKRVPELLDQLDEAELRDKINIYFAPVIPYTDVCVDISSSCITGRTWSKLQTQLQLYAFERGYGGPSLPPSKTHVCLADNMEGKVISPSGLIFKCWNNVTQPQNAVFDLSSKTQTPNMKKTHDQWTNWSPFNQSECVECNILPQCMGGCPYLSLQQKDQPKNDYCKELKHNLPETIAIYYLNYKRKEEAKLLMKKLHQWLPDIVPELEKEKIDRAQ
jgi:uncharacterized protein